jgi:hypothetical protein
MVTTTLEIKPEFGYVLATAIVTGFHCTLQGFSVAAIRYKAATPEYFAKHFPEENDGQCVNCEIDVNFPLLSIVND